MLATETLSVPYEVPAIQVQLSRVALVTAPGLNWSPDEGARYFDVHLGDSVGEKVGDIQINYFYEARYARPHTELSIKGQGIGTEIYTAIPFIPLPCGKDFKEAGFKLQTYGHSDAANRLWESLVRKGLARTLSLDRSYEMLDTVPPPDHLEITEHGMLPTSVIEDC